MKQNNQVIIRAGTDVKMKTRRPRRPANPTPGVAAETGPQACLRLYGCVPSIAAVVAPVCAKCGEVPETRLHIPLRVAGAFCPGCCPVCNSKDMVVGRARLGARGGDRGHA